MNIRLLENFKNIPNPQDEFNEASEPQKLLKMQDRKIQELSQAIADLEREHENLQMRRPQRLPPIEQQ